MITEYELRRMNYCVRTQISEHALKEWRGVSVEAFAEQAKASLIFHLRVGIMCQEKRVEVDCGPAGHWQMLKALLGLPHRRAVRVFEARQMFPDIPATVSRTYISIKEVGDAS